jgi:hypothetical protein
MTKVTSLKLALATGGLITLSMLAAPLTGYNFSANNFDLIATAHADEGGSSGKKKSGKAQGGSHDDHGTTHGSGKGKKDIMMKGQGGPGEDSDSDRPIWAGVKGGKAGAGGRPEGSGTSKGDLYGDLWIILRNDNGEPILTPEGYVQPIDVEGNTIPLDEEGKPTNLDLVQEVEFSRLSVSRAPSKVLSHSLDEATSKILAATDPITLDAAGRVVVDGSTIDSPLENLALYNAVMTNTLPADVLAKLGSVSLSAPSLLAAAADKYSEFNVDTLVYLNSFLGINTVVDGVTTDYHDFLTDYDREATYSGQTVEVLQLVPGSDPATYVVTSVPLYGTDGFFTENWVDTTDGFADDFAAATNDAIQVLEFIHDNEPR